MKRMRSRRAKIVRWTSIAIAAVLVAGTFSAYIVIKLKLDGITHIAKIDATHRPPRYNDATNILLLGSDDRHGHNGSIGGRNGCNCSDTIMVAHISPGRGKVTVVSIPRDTMVPLYACSPWNGLPGQQADPYAVERINATLAAGGPECVRETVEQQSGVYIDNVIEIDFTAFEQVINDVGGVNVCLPFSIHNVITLAGGTGLDLTAGYHHIWGRVALQFWRTREDIADGSDIARIARDQYLLAQLVKGVLRSGLLHSPSKLYKVLGDVATNMVTDASDVGLLHLATSLAGVSTSNVQFITAPWVSYPGDPNEVEFAQPQANAVFWAIAHDTKLPKITKKKGKRNAAVPGTSPTPVSTPTVGTAAQPLTVSPSLVKVLILNGSSGANLTSQASADLTSRGFTVVGTGYAATTSYTTSVIQYASATDLPAARTLKQQFSSVTLQLDPSLTAGTVQVILGSDFTKLAPPTQTAQAVSGLSTNYGGITANVSCRNSAFYGYYDQSPVPNTCAC
ncbi:MAG TPA: LCP family protein [Streptosporangiaceae bacterium]|nr:LCP family protein [Streptosporangiaceae bacterium]